MVFIELHPFTRDLRDFLNDDNYSSVQGFLMGQPERGTIIPGSGGLRKLRWRMPGHGKRGGLRIVYYWAVAEHIIYLLAIYAKSDKEDMTRAELSLLKRIIEDE